MPQPDNAKRFIEEAVKHPEWLQDIEKQETGETVTRVAKEQGFECTFEELQAAAREIVGSGGAEGETPTAAPDEKQVDEAAAGMGDSQEMGYGSDTGYALYYGLAGTILKMKPGGQG